MYFFSIIIFLLSTTLVVSLARSTSVLRTSFWLLISYSFLLLTHFFSGITYRYGSIYHILPYFLLCIALLIIGETIGRAIKLKTWAIGFKVKLKSISIISIIGSVLFIVDILRLNQINLGTRIDDFNVSIMGVLGNAVSSLGMIIWLTSLYHYRINKLPIPLISYISVIAFVAGGMLSAGRQAIFMIVLSSVIMMVWSSVKKKELKKAGREIVVVKMPKPWGFYIILLLFACYFMFISFVRSGIFDIDNKIEGFERNFNATTSVQTKKIVHNIGGLSDIYIEFSYYYSHELIHLDLLYQYYDYPPLFGLSQLNYIERRLQWLVGNQDEKSEKEVENALDNKGRVYSHTWGTFISDFILDFGRVGAPIACLVLGVICGVLYRKFKSRENSMTIIRQVIICTGIAFSIQYSPIAELFYFIPLVMSSFMIIIPNKS